MKVPFSPLNSSKAISGSGMLNWMVKPHNDLLNLSEWMEQMSNFNVDKFIEENNSHANVKC